VSVRVTVALVGVIPPRPPRGVRRGAGLRADRYGIVALIDTVVLPLAMLC
jgi:hypothetical protein